MNASNRPAGIFHIAGFVLVLALLAGCGKSKPKEAADVEPFKKAIGEYLERNNMAMAVKEVKEGPIIEETQANLKASLTHATMGGPAVTWQFTLEKDPKGAWRVLRHKP